MFAAEAAVEDRAAFLTRTYLHLCGAIFAFVGIEAALFVSGVADRIAAFVFEGPLSGRGGWLAVLGLFMVVSWVADWWARSDTSSAMQYAGLLLYVVAESVIFVPLLKVAELYAPDVIPTAGLTTLVIFAGLTAVVLITRKDFSFLRGILILGAFGAFGLILAGVIFDFALGTLFCWGMVFLASGYILYYTSNVLHHYRTDQHVAAALALFSAFALLLWYVIRIFLNRRG